MALSGSTDFDLSLNEIIQEVAEDLQIVQEHEEVDSKQHETIKRTFNILMKALHNKGINLWKIEELVKAFSDADVVSNNSVNYKCQLPHTSSADDEPGVGDNSSKFWVITEDTAAGAWALSTAYTTPAAFDLDSSIIGIDRAFYRDNTGSDTPVEVTSYSKLSYIWDKDKTGTMTHIALERKRGQSRLHIYQPSNLTTDVLHYFAIKKHDDFDNDTDNADIYQRGLMMLIRMLTYNLTKKYRQPANMVAQMKLDMEEAIRDFKKFNLDDDDSDFIMSSHGFLHELRRIYY